ncbi:prenyltransferase [Desulfonatronovibrio hydrogenovorans]|uniref:prenyltransferase n=1 Tax=Desulfonatronovibrio hydrogenovorans TaxID=53245 RepID=UPI001378B97F|nr:prenyltransferase [Desulfonatronovibrio hydrogenovorans]
MPSQLYIFLPLLLGQSMAHAQGNFSWEIFALCHFYGLAVQLFIVFANDIADVETDTLNRTHNIFSGGSRVLVDRSLSRKSLTMAALIFGLLCIAVGLVLGWLWNNWGPLLLILSGHVLVWAYSFRPFQLSYRGGGEFLQMLGVGGLLPVTGYLAQQGNLSCISWPLIVLMLLLSLTCAMSTSLPDQPSDRMSGKKSSSVIFGNRINQRLILVLNGLALALIVLVPAAQTRGPENLYIFAACAVLWASGIPFLDSKPGSRGLLIFVALCVGFSLTPMAGFSMALLLS